MAQIEASFWDLTYLDALAYRESLVHSLDARIKLLTTLLFVLMVISFNRYQITALIPFFIYPVALIAGGNLPASYLLKKILLAAPFAFFIGVFNPLFDRETLIQVGSIGISGGWISFVSIMIRFALTVSAALVLIATSGFNAVCMSLEKIGVPTVFAVQLLFLYRYLFVLTEEAARMVRARSLRSFGGRGMGIKVFGYMVGQLFLRTFDRAQRIHLSMLCRGFDGEIRFRQPMRIHRRDWLFLLGWSALFVLMRFFDVTRWVGTLVTEWVK